MLGDCFPFATADFNVVPGVNGLADSPTYISVTGFVICFVNGAANITIVSFTNRTSDVVAHISVAGVVNRLADCVADIAIAGVVHRPSAFAGYSAVAGFVNGTADFVADVAITGVVNRLANRVAFITVAGLVNVLGVLHGNFFADCVIHCFLTGIVLLFPYGFYDSFVAGTRAFFGSTVIATRSTCFCGATIITTCSQVSCLGLLPKAGHYQSGRQKGNPGCVFHWSIPLHDNFSKQN
jgi:hypothetical protein